MPPALWLVSQVCEEFGCLPSQAVRELEGDPERMVIKIMTLRAYVRTLAAFDRHLANDKSAVLEPGPLLQWVKRHTARFVEQEARRG